MKYNVDIYTTTKQHTRVVVEAKSVDDAREAAGAMLDDELLEWDEYDWTCDEMNVVGTHHEVSR